MLARWNVAFVFLLFVLGTAGAESLALRNFEVSIYVNQDSSFLVNESITMYFGDQFNEAYRQIRLRNSEGTGFSITKIVVRENGLPLEARITHPETDLIDIAWDAPPAGSTRTYVLSYEVRSVITRYNDVSDLYWRAFGEQWSVPAEHFKATVFLPAGVTNETTLAWGFGPETGTVEIFNGRVEFEDFGVPAGQWVEVRVVFPSAFVASGEHAGAVFGREGLQEIIDDAERTRQEKEYWEWVFAMVSYAVAAVGVLLFIFLAGAIVFVWYSHGREREPDFKGKYFRDFPGRYPPAILGCLLDASSKKPGFDDFAATLVDLARRGFIQIQEVKLEKKGLEKLFPGEKNDVKLTRLKKDEKELESFERKAIEIVFKKNNSVLVKQELAKRAHSFSSQFDSWRDDVSEKAKQYGFHEEKSSFSWVLVGGGIAGFVYCAVMFVFLNDALLCCGSIVPLAVISTAALVTSGRPMERRTQNGANDYARWMALKNFFSSFSQMKMYPPSSVVLWDEYLVYAISLGVADKVLRYMEVELPKTGAHAYRPSWIVATRAGTLSSLNSIRVMQSSVRTVATAMQASSSGRGGGFSSSGSFGGGGFGGGGGGAR